MTALAINVLDPSAIVSALGVIGVALTLFVETGLLIGLVLPGDSLLFVAGLAASGTAVATLGVQLPIVVLLIASAVCAIVGAQVGHWIGHRYGRRLFDRPDGRVFTHERVERAEALLARYGEGRAIILARFIPIVRTLINPICGVIGIPARRFAVWNVIGGLIWTQGIILLGYFLGNRISGSIDVYLLPIIGLIIAISVAPIAFDVLRQRRKARYSPRSESE
jgi:membrane-associated protein